MPVTPRHSQSLRQLSLLAAVCLIASPVFAGFGERSPFLPHNYNVPAPVQEAPRVQPTVQRGLLSNEYDLRGIFLFGDPPRFTIFSKRDSRSFLIPLNGSARINREGEELEIIGFNPKTPSVTIRLNGQVEQLELAESDGMPMPISAASTPRLPAPAISRPTTSQVRNGSTSERPRRVIVPRRRTLRTDSGSPPPGAPPPPGQ